MNTMKLSPIGKVKNGENAVRIELDSKYREGLIGLEGYSHVQVIWWADGCDNNAGESTLVEKKPYKNGPDEIGVFATRSPERPNPIAVSNVDIAYVDVNAGIVGLYYIDANDETPVLDLKPYTPSIDRIEAPRTPDWCCHWPKSYEDNGDFDWESEFNF